MQATRDDFLQSGWETVIARSNDRECNDYRSHLWQKAREGKDANDSKSEELFRLLGDICSLNQRLDSPDQPYGPMMTSQQGRTAIPEDFDAAQIEFLNDIVRDVTDAELKARIADVLWFLRRDYKMGELAVSAYLESATILEDPRNWVATYDRISRALQLARMMGRNAQSYPLVIRHIEDVLTRCNGEDPLFLSARLMNLVQECRIGDAAKYAALSEKLALKGERERDWDRARTYWETKAQWHTVAKEEVELRAAKLRAAETYVQQAEAHLSGNPPSYSLASTFLQKAIEAFRRVGDSETRIQQLHSKLLEYQKKSVSELRHFSYDIDITETVTKAIESVKGKSVLDAMLALATIIKPLSVGDLRSQADENRQKYVLQSLLTKIYVNAFGRVIANHPIDEEEGLRADMCGLATQFHSIEVQAIIEPARRQVVADHNIRVSDFALMLSDHRLIPAGREMIVARGLYAGLNGDFVVSTHLLVPQLEESVRYLLTQRSVIASSLDGAGVQEEIDLNRTLCSSKFAKPLAELLGADILFEMRTLLVERFGANLRNDMAHGLVDLDSFYSPSARYLWWLALHLYSFPVLARLKAEHEQRAHETSIAQT